MDQYLIQRVLTMSENGSRGRNIPTSRISRFSKMSSLAARITGSVVAGGAIKLLSGERPALKSLVLTPANIKRITDQLATMRGAAMKIGQILSIDDGEFLPPELSAILARLRDDAEPMPKQQLQEVLDDAWGEGWKNNLLYFSYAPIAAASIGQVHKVILLDGTMLAVKVQYPGIRTSIDSDVDNVMGLVKLVGIIPEQANIQPLLEEAKAQLHDEANYHHEAKMLHTYSTLLKNDNRFICPKVDEQWTTDTVLAMTFLKGEPVAALESASQDLKDTMMTNLFELFFKEVFEFQCIQSDPNLANYLVNLETQQWILLDFGATRKVPNYLKQGYIDLINAANQQNNEAILVAAEDIGLIDDTATDAQLHIVLAMLNIACEPLHSAEGHNFSCADSATRLQEYGWALSMQEDFWQAPPADAVFVHRKLGGLYLLAKRLKATVNMKHTSYPIYWG